ncbi:hypothetical protein [Actinoplanes derwentensis]|uniref:Poxvirus protein I5 n=1 Tax=Actinoplanes derwentensis TaxID=113562 RepID=A0A1H2B838_9ACTN|nr:hypothetical protein [Actinoplanes derwentensis]GID86450.1 hypothetical protein Ade03nite_53740 [Actinoplanes derwentensis]SDT54435.1 hypothetical protein SAMN04489716_4418 [Actinoplanes derwentensis]
MNARFALFGEVLITGVAVTAASLGLVTALPAALAGAAHLRRHIDGEGGGPQTVAADFREALRRLPAASVALPVLTALLTWNLTFGRQAGPAAFTACLIIAAVGTVAVLRLAGSWTPADPPGSVTAIRAALRRTAADPIGSALLAGALLGATTITWMLLPLSVITPGLLLLASLAVHRRRAGRHLQPQEQR